MVIVDIWGFVFTALRMDEHDFMEKPFIITANQIRKVTKSFQNTGYQEPGILCTQLTRESRPLIFKDNNLFLLPIQNGKYAIVKGEGYVDIPEIYTLKFYKSKLDFVVETVRIGNSAVQHLDYAYAASAIRTFIGEGTLMLSIRGRKYSPTAGFSFNVNKHKIDVRSVQTQIDAGI